LIILKWVLRKQDERASTGFIWLTITRYAGSGICEQGTEPPGSIEKQRREFPDGLSDYQLLKKDSVASSYRLEPFGVFRRIVSELTDVSEVRTASIMSANDVGSKQL
jgi:hypothetical protein